MGLKDIPFLSGFFNQSPVRSSLSLDSAMFKLSQNISYKEYALQLCINKLASAMSLCRVETTENGMDKKDHYWWKFNYEPNNNVNAPDFLYQIIYEMVWNENGALVYQTDDGNLVVAENYQMTESSIYENVYHDISLYGGYELDGYYGESQVLRFQLPNKEVRRLINGLYKDYGELIQVTSNAYMRERSMKLLLNIDTLFDQQYGKSVVNAETGETEADNILDDILTNRFKGVFAPNDTMTPLESGLSVSSLDESRSSTVSGQIKANEVTELFDGVINLTADAFAIPRGLLKGDVADAEAITQNFITFAVRPLAKELESEINRKLYKKDKVISGTKLKFDTETIQTYNLVTFANAADKLVAATIFNPNELRRKLGEEPSTNKELDKYKETKNYQEAGTTENEG